MKPQKQLYRHNPADGVYGDCHRTAIACLLDLDVEEVPHVYASGATPKAAWSAMEAWLHEHYELRQVSVAYTGDSSLEQVLASIDSANPDLSFILGGTSRTGCNHSVVCKGVRIVCDPSLDNAGIVGPCDDGLWWVTFLGRST